jgi:UDP-N-acetyl-D-glucosamine dehydrogenase
MSTSELWRTTEASLRARQGGVAVVGLGYVGLPLLAAFLEAGYRPVLGYDRDAEKIECLRRGESYIGAVPAHLIDRAYSDGRLSTTVVVEAVRSSLATCICVPTPLHSDRTPDLDAVESTVTELAPNLREGSLLVLVSTTYPGTTREVVAPLLAAAGRRVGEDVYLAYSPEREDPGNPQYGVRNTPRVVGADDPGSRALVEALFDGVVGRVVPVSSTAAAEATKILENTYRAVNIAMVNEFKIILDALGLDVREVIQAAATKPFGYVPFSPGPGFGGHCIPVDPFYLAWRARQAGQEARFIELAGEVNRRLPGWVLDKLDRGLAGRHRSIDGSRVLILGLAYKADIDDPRESPAFELLSQLLERGARVSYHDPHIPVAPRMRSWDLPPLQSVPLTAAVLEEHDAVIIATAHQAVDHELVVEHSPLVVDTRGVTRGLAARARHPERVIDA